MSSNEANIFFAIWELNSTSHCQIESRLEPKSQKKFVFFIYARLSVVGNITTDV